MKRWSALLWVVVLVVASFILYRVKYEVQAVRVQISETEKELQREREALHVVAAEWAYLNRPERLQALADKYLSNAPMTVDRIAEIEAIPFPKVMEAKAAPQKSDIHPVSVLQEPSQ